MRLWKSKQTGKTHLTHEQWEPLEIKFDEKFYKELDPEMMKMVGDRKIAHGVLIQCGWMVRSTGNVWMAMPLSISDLFDDIGEGSLDSEFEAIEVML